MKTIEYRTVDKSEWLRGEWDNEPDKVQWQDEVTGLPCLIVRGPSGALCGYVGVAEGHKLHGKYYDHEEVSISAHGGLTFADKCQPREHESEGICHLPDAGEPDHAWWFGFDCAHSGDLCPKYMKMYQEKGLLMPSGYETYKTIQYVRDEVTNIAAQLKAVA